MDNYTITSYTRENGQKVYTLEKNGTPVKQSTNILLLQTALINIQTYKNLI